MLPPVPFSVHHCCLRSRVIPTSGWYRSVLCTLTPWRVAQTAHLDVLHKPGSLFFSWSYKLLQMPSAESLWTVWKHGFQNSGALQQILSWSSCLMHLFLKENGLDVLSNQVIWPTEKFNLFLEVVVWIYEIWITQTLYMDTFWWVLSDSE